MKGDGAGAAEDDDAAADVLVLVELEPPPDPDSPNPPEARRDGAASCSNRVVRHEKSGSPSASRSSASHCIAVS